ncbi:ankyrin repeat-containing domain protein [Schizophyllum amplum]|uniref:Ankyrin repeat-containing domain protein n=1 Tax=Schizophyllum amplum TaxID=97359 RepID=A0A550CVN0_9AGAR|nr:ankyrin repeat-containing domain protein [Auriculariopsis ampla]
MSAPPSAIDAPDVVDSKLTPPTDDELDEFRLCCRYGDLDDVNAFLARFPDAACAADDAGNTPAHMAAANGHADVLSSLLAARADPAAANAAGATPMHWAALNAQLGTVEALFKAGGARLIDVKDGLGRSPLGVAEQSGWDEGARWMVERMDLSAGTAEEGDAAEDGADEKVDGHDIEVEIEDAEGGIARMAIGPDGKATTASESTAAPA